ncbi:hypothetical protein MML48_9g00001458 [Holotrichia oblita]|uniref:Uncharacterized protein n=1 Tax=Holotrichia oblita TaxID=644536 RepID=A0ACB9SJV1_HOLOL|nr:hypothetical protein MML48_9g00001458 [Holotrichia oblita]
MRKHFDFLIEKRTNFVNNNDFVFHTSGKGFIDGTKVLHKYVNKCKVDRPGSITATTLRKHLATITQLLQFSNNDMEQLSKFMGHTLKTHCDVYRMSDKIYQTAKVSKLLLLMTEGGAAEYREKSLDDINIDLNPVYDNENLVDDIDLSPAQPENVESDQTLTATNSQPKKKAKLVKLDKRETWTPTQKKIIAEYFSHHIKKKKAPKQHEVAALTNIYPEFFKDKKWTSIKAVIYNIYTGKLKQ